VTSLSVNGWYTQDGPDNDVVISTRLRLARNLASFPFPHRERGEDGERVLSAVLDSFAQVSDHESWQSNRVDCLPPLRRGLLMERGVLSNSDQSESPPPPAGIVLRADGCLACTINQGDHLRISAFASGLNTADTWELCHNLDEELQRTLQFAASYETGFLTSSLFDAGSGMKISVHAHLPAIELAGQEAFAQFLSAINGRGFVAETYYGLAPNGMPFGSYYRIRNANSVGGTEFDQIAALNSTVKYVAAMERRFRAELLEARPTILRDRVYRAFATVKYSRFMEEREAAILLSDIKLGIDTGIITWSEPRAGSLNALFYRIKRAHLETVIRSGNFAWERDVANQENLRIQRMRTLVMQDALDGLLIRGTALEAARNTTPEIKE
jgi:protein arginine kinase